jgi:hypothetical protein
VDLSLGHEELTISAQLVLFEVNLSVTQQFAGKDSGHPVSRWPSVCGEQHKHDGKDYFDHLHQPLDQDTGRRTYPQLLTAVLLARV